MPIDLTQLRGYISDMYRDVAQYPRAEFHFPTGRPVMEALGYPVDMLDRIVPTALESFAGVGYYFDLDPLKPGERVLDLGSGSASDALYAALSVGETGEVVGVDMTDKMLAKARDNAKKAGLGHVRFEEAFIEDLPFEDDYFDCAISNGVFNLSPKKHEVFAGVRRVLKPGGRLMFSDIVTGVELPSSVRENCELWAECIGGAQEEKNYLGIIEGAGFTVEEVRHNNYLFSEGSTRNAAEKFSVKSVSVLARKPA